MLLGEGFYKNHRVPAVTPRQGTWFVPILANRVSPASQSPWALCSDIEGKLSA